MVCDNVKLAGPHRGHCVGVAVILSAFIVSRILCLVCGTRFDDSSLDWHWQYLDVPLLTDNLLASCFYLHSQPPGFNLLLGWVLKIAPAHSTLVFHLLFIGCGLTLAISIYSTLATLRVNRNLAVLLPVLFLISPPVLLYENYLFYTYPVAALLSLATALLASYIRTNRTGYVFGFFLVLAAVCCIRSMFHLVYLLGCLALITMLRPSQWRNLCMAAMPALLLVFSLYLKNAILFGTFGASSWLGMNLWNVARENAPRGPLIQLMESERLIEVVNYPTFKPLSTYPARYNQVPDRFAGIDALTLELKQSGHPNLNHYGYILLEKEYRRASVLTVRTFPRSYLRSVADGFLIYFSPSAHYRYLQGNAAQMKQYVTSWNEMGSSAKVDLSSVYRALFGEQISVSYPWPWLVCLPLVFVAGVIFLFIRRVTYGLRRTEVRVVCAFSLFTIAFVALVGNFFDLGENNRFRFLTNPFYFVLFSLCVDRLIRFTRHFYADLRG